MVHKIAIIVSGYSYNHNDDYSRVVESITDWTEVSDSDFKLLKESSGRRGFDIIEQPVDTPGFIRTTVAEEIELARQEAEKKEKEKKARDAKVQAKKHVQALKDQASKLALFEKLKAELGQ